MAVFEVEEVFAEGGASRDPVAGDAAQLVDCGYDVVGDGVLGATLVATLAEVRDRKLL